MREATKHISLAADLSLPLQSVTQTFAFIARRGAGKTYAAGKLCEGMLDAQAQVIVLDPVGNWYGLRIAADGKGRGFDIPVLGGLHADLPLPADAGALIADFAVGSGASLVLDVSMMRKGERKKFATDFAERLFHLKKSNRSPIHLFVEEAQVFIPQRVDKDEARMLGAFEDIVRLGRNFGIGATLISQRPQSVNKEVLNQTECLVVLQTNGTQERKAIEDWMVLQGMTSKELAAELPSLEVGNAWVWSPQWLKIIKKVKIAPKRTLDASATPVVGATPQNPQPLAPIDLGQLEQQMAEVTRRAAADDPKALRKRIAELEKQLAAKPAAEVERVEVPVLTDHDRGLLASARESVTAAVEVLSRELALFGGLQIELQRKIPGGQAPPPIAQPKPRVEPEMFSKTSRANDEPVRTVTTSDGISQPRQRILNALADFERMGLFSVSRSNVAVFADVSPSSSGFTNNLGGLRSAGLIDYPTGGMVALTAEGRAVAEPQESIRSLGDLHEAWASKLPRPRWAILSALIRAYPDSIAKTELAELAGQSPTSSGYTNNVSGLRSLGLLDYPQPGYVVATELLFPEGLR